MLFGCVPHAGSSMTFPPRPSAIFWHGHSSAFQAGHEQLFLRARVRALVLGTAKGWSCPSASLSLPAG
eukprot:11905387-Alexandrium_andersonii.AAC.1